MSIHFYRRGLDDSHRMYDEQKPDIIIHLVAVVGGIGANRTNPEKFFYDNAISRNPVLHETYLRQIEKFVALGTIRCYPKYSPIPFQEIHLWDGSPEEINAPTD